MKVRAGFRFFIASYFVIFNYLCVIPSEDFNLVSYIDSVHVFTSQGKTGNLAPGLRI